MLPGSLSASLPTSPWASCSGTGRPLLSGHPRAGPRSPTCPRASLRTCPAGPNGSCSWAFGRRPRCSPSTSTARPIPLTARCRAWAGSRTPGPWPRALRRARSPSSARPRASSNGVANIAPVPSAANRPGPRRAAGNGSVRPAMPITSRGRTRWSSCWPCMATAACWDARRPGLPACFRPSQGFLSPESPSRRPAPASSLRRRAFGQPRSATIRLSPGPSPIR